VKIEFLDRFSKNNQISNLMKIGQEGADLFRADGKTDRQRERERYDKASSRSSQFRAGAFKPLRRGQQFEFNPQRP
jgi:hypothetical protein